MKIKKLMPILLTLVLTSTGCITTQASTIKNRIIGKKYETPIYDGIFCAKGSSSESKKGLEVFAAKYKDKNMYDTQKGRFVLKAPINELEYGWEIILKDPKGFHRLTNNSIKEYHPRIDPNGNHVVFERKEKDKQEIYKIDLKTGLETKLTEQGNCKNPVISPDGQKIAYNFNDNIWIMDKDGSNQRELLNLNQKMEIYDWAEEGLIFCYGDSMMPNAIIDFEKKEVNDYRLGQK